MRKTSRGLLAALIISIPGWVQAQGDDAAVAIYDALLREADGLVIYNEVLQSQIETQERAIEQLRIAIGQVPELEQEIPPLLTQAIDGLEEFVASDIPFLEDERAQRLAELQSIVESENVQPAEKFRRILEAWQVENEYGRTVSAYDGELQIDGATRDVQFLRLGRTAWFYQSRDEELLTGAWDVRTGAWVPLVSQHRNPVRQAIQMARNQIASQITLLPITPPQ